MLRLSFRFKVTLAMLLLVGGISAACLLLVQREVNRYYQGYLARQFEQQVELLYARQLTRMTAVRSSLTDALQNPRVIAALEASNYDRLYNDLVFQLEFLLTRSGDGERALSYAPFFRYLSKSGSIIPASHPQAGLVPGMPEDELDKRLESLAVTKRYPAGRVGYLDLPVPTGQQLYEIYITPIQDSEHPEVDLGELVFATPLPTGETIPGGPDVLFGIIVDRTIHAPGIPRSLHQNVLNMVREGPGELEQGREILELDGVPQILFCRRLPTAEGFPIVGQVALYSLAGLKSLISDIRVVIGGFMAVALLFGLFLSFLAATQLTRPIQELVAGTQAVQKGSLEVTLPVRSGDELGQLTHSFNTMTRELANKEKYRAVLDKVTDPQVAAELTRGFLQLGGELRLVTILFCDIRGFTPMTRGMPPQTVIEMLNEHMSTLTGLIASHQGVVDKFVGDSIMVIFGAPRQYGDDAWRAVRCAQAMVQERHELNRHSRFQIHIGIGIATGEVVAGCMGSEKRLNYTVLGERVNLAARLCSQAQPDEILICPETRSMVEKSVSLIPRRGLTLKGLSTDFVAYSVTGSFPP